MVSALISRSSGPGSNLVRGHCFAFALLSQCLSPPKCINRLNAEGNPAMGQHPIQGGVEIFLVTSCCRNRYIFLSFSSHFNRNIKVKFSQIPQSSMDPLSRKLRQRHFCPSMKFYNLHFLFLGVCFKPKEGGNRMNVKMARRRHHT